MRLNNSRKLLLNSHKFASSKAFTLIELIIAIAIVVLIGGIILANYRVGQRQQTLRAEAQKLASTLRQAQNMALAGKTYPCTTGKPEPQNYGVYFSSAGDSYTLFVDCDEEGDCNEAIADMHVLEAITLPSNVSMSFSQDCYVYTRPHGSLPGTGTVDIVVSLDARKRTVSVNKDTGQISLD